jgi:signal transduction histidine kinase
MWALRRVWRNARRLAARSKGREQLIELASVAGGLAHEIKNPLSTINLNLRLLAEDLGRHDDELHRRLLRRLGGIREEADRLKGTLDDFLRFAGKYELTLQKVDIRSLIHELADFFAPQAEAAGVVLRTALSESPVYCNVDPNLLKQALLNLMVNAVEAMEDGGELLIRLSSADGRAVLEVIDTGPGIDAEKLPHVFDVYYSTKPRGSGLGLPTTRRIVREHGGTIQFESDPPKGTRFIIKLPIVTK